MKDQKEKKMNNKVLYFLLLSFLVGCTSIRPQSQEAIEYYKMGYEYYTKQDYPKALDNFSHAITLDPGFAEAFYGRAVTYFEMQDKQNALADFTEAIKIRPRFKLAYNNRGLLYAELGNYDEALSDLSLLITMEPRNANNYANRAAIYIKMEKHDDAFHDLARAIRIDKNCVAAYENRAALYYKLNDYRDSINDYQYLININSDNAATYYTWCGFMFIQLEDNEEAQNALTQAIKLMPQNAIFYKNRGEFYSNIRKYQEALSDFSSAIEIDNNYIDAYEERAKLYILIAEQVSDKEKQQELHAKAEADLNSIKEITSIQNRQSK
jgi:tetratricopeptide (TPR) repeat protein